MKTIETQAHVSSSGTLVAQLPANILPGEHYVILVIDEKPLKKDRKQALHFPLHGGGGYLDLPILRRENLYGAEGR